jgi:hypothetical protein
VPDLEDARVSAQECRSGGTGRQPEFYEQHGHLEQVRGLLGHARIETTQLYAQIRPAALKQAVEF